MPRSRRPTPPSFDRPNPAVFLDTSHMDSIPVKLTDRMAIASSQIISFQAISGHLPTKGAAEHSVSMEYSQAAFAIGDSLLRFGGGSGEQLRLTFPTLLHRDTKLSS